MELDEARRFLADNHRAVLATTRADGSSQLSPVAVAVDGDGRAAVSSRETAFKVKNIRRRPQVSLCVLSEGWYGRWVQVDGSATIVSLPEAMEPLVDLYRRVAGEHPDWDEYRSAMEREKRVVIRVELERAGPDREG